MDHDERRKTEDGTDHHDEAPVPRAMLTGTAMFLPALIVFTIALVVILVFVF